MRIPAPVGQLLMWAMGGVVVGLGLSYYQRAAGPPGLAVSPSAVAAEASSSRNVFGSDAAIVLKFVRADKVAAFEATIARLREALAMSGTLDRRQQGRSWRVFRAIEPAANGDVVYVFDIDPVVKGADYSVSRILRDAFPEEAHALYSRYADALDSGQHVIELTLVATLASDPTP